MTPSPELDSYVYFDFLSHFQAFIVFFYHYVNIYVMSLLYVFIASASYIQVVIYRLWFGLATRVYSRSYHHSVMDGDSKCMAIRVSHKVGLYSFDNQHFSYLCNFCYLVFHNNYSYT